MIYIRVLVYIHVVFVGECPTKSYLARSGVPRQETAVAINKDEVQLVYGHNGILRRESSRFNVVAKLLWSKSSREIDPLSLVDCTSTADVVGLGVLGGGVVMIWRGRWWWWWCL